MSSQINYDTKRMACGPADFKALKPKLEAAKNKILQLSESGAQGWMDVVNDAKLPKIINKTCRETAKFTTCLVLGIGGSDLAARALYKALKPANSKKRLVFAGANTDPDELAEVLDDLDWKTTVINVISKSGRTIETMSAFFIAREKMEKRLGKIQAAKQIIATTSENSGDLRELAKKENYLFLPIPENIGGRFSGLTAVGLFPLAFAGTDVASILKGAREQIKLFKSQKSDKNNACLFAGLQYLAYTKQKRQIQILMPYAERLREFAFWYRQLWAESLGKEKNTRGETVNIGPTPVAALGATDQHSQIQLYTEGPDDKTVTFIEVEKFQNSLAIPKSVKSDTNFRKLAGIKLEKIIHAERAATEFALQQKSRPSGTLYLKSLNAVSMGELIMFFELATAVSGELYGINAYNQPGVEAGKIKLESILGI